MGLTGIVTNTGATLANTVFNKQKLFSVYLSLNAIPIKCRIDN